jgi:two-component system chemotaxis response regulator CheB
VTKIFAIGASLGGVQALHVLLAGLPANFAAPILIVQHIGATESILPAILADACSMPTAFALDGEPLRSGHVYVAPPDHHMLVNAGQLELTRGPRENWARPAIDPLFRAAAMSYRQDAVGIVLSGRLNDGTSGLYEIKRWGGIAMVQTPGEAEAPSMPQSALDNVPVDYCLPVTEMPRLMIRLANDAGSSVPPTRGESAAHQAQMIQPSAQTCPECGGVMRTETMSRLTRFRCHIGHVMTAEVLASSQLDELENNLSTVLRTLNERAGLCRDLAAKHRAAGNVRAAEAWRKAAEQAESRQKTAQAMVDLDGTHPERTATRRNDYSGPPGFPSRFSSFALAVRRSLSIRRRSLMSTKVATTPSILSSTVR